MNNRTITCLLLCSSVAFAQGPGAFVRAGGGPGGGFGRAGFGRGGFGAARPVTGAPYSGVEVRTFEEQLASGNVISRTSQTTLYRDSQGRTRSEETVTPAASTGKQPFTRIVISDPVAGQRHVLDSSTMTSVTSRIPMVKAGTAGNGRGGGQARPAGTGTPASRTGRNGAAVTRTELGSQVKNGVLATGTLETEVIPAGKIGNSQAITVTRETWFSTELKMPVEAKTTDPQHGNSTMEMTNLVAGEPSAALFAVPSGYTEKNVGRGGRGGFRGARPGQQ